MVERICAKIGRRCHISRASARVDFIPFIKIMLKKPKASGLLSWFELVPEEVEFLTKMNKL
jgi:hypothetical protein